MPTLYQSQYPLAWPRHDWRQGTFRAPSILPIANLQDLQFWTCDATPDSSFSNFGKLFTNLITREFSTKLIRDQKSLTPPQVCLFGQWDASRIRTLRHNIHDASKLHFQIIAKYRLFSSFPDLLFYIQLAATRSPPRYPLWRCPAGKSTPCACLTDLSELRASKNKLASQAHFAPSRAICQVVRKRAAQSASKGLLEVCVAEAVPLFIQIQRRRPDSQPVPCRPGCVCESYCAPPLSCRDIYITRTLGTSVKTKHSFGLVLVS